MSSSKLIPLGLFGAIAGFTTMSCRFTPANEPPKSSLYSGDEKASDSPATGEAGRLQQQTAATATPASCPVGAAFKVVGGQSVEESDLAAASTVKIWIGDVRFCTGTLIGPQHIVTAAHCIKNGATEEDFRIGFGVDGLLVEDLKVRSHLVHPSFKGIISDGVGFKDQAFSDVALLLLDSPVGLGMKPVALAQPEFLYPGMDVLLTGYGAYSSTDKQKRQLTQVDLQIASMRGEYKEFQLQTGAGKGACFGDSGGPTFIRAEQGQCLLLAGSTTGPGRDTDLTCESGGGTVMDLTRYRDWIGCSFAKMKVPLPGFTAEEAASCGLDAE